MITIAICRTLIAITRLSLQFTGLPPQFTKFILQFTRLIITIYTNFQACQRKRWSIMQKIHDKAQPVSKSLAEMGGQSSGLTPYMLAGEWNVSREPRRPWMLAGERNVSREPRRPWMLNGVSCVQRPRKIRLLRACLPSMKWDASRWSSEMVQKDVSARCNGGQTSAAVYLLG